jgi:hypothetical protein
LENQNVIFNTENCTNFLQTFFNCKITVIPTINLTNATNTTNLFSGNYMLDTIEKCIVSDTTPFTNTFNSCTALRVLIFEGVIGQNGLNLSTSKSLTAISLRSIINCLKDYSEDTSGTKWEVTLGQTNLYKLTNEEKAIATEKGWTLA